MINNTEDYQQFVESIINKCGVLRTNTLINCLMKYYANIESRSDALYILRALQDFTDLMLTDDGYAITKGCYLRLVDDPALMNIRFGKVENLAMERLEKLPADIIHINDSYDEDLLECMTIVADMMPDSRYFMVTGYPWMIQFIVNARGNPDEKGYRPSRLFQICKIENANEIPFSILLNSLPEFSDAEYKEHVRRVAIIDNANQSYLVPKLGFTAICTYDPDNIETEYKIVETRSQDIAWQDYQRNINEGGAD